MGKIADFFGIDKSRVIRYACTENGPRGSFSNPPTMANRLITYLKESREEMKKVVWPSRQETIRHTGLVIGLTLGVALFLGVMDFLLNLALQQFIK